MPSKREQLIDKAIELFAAHGFHGTGIDRIAQEANVTKKTMYHHFRSKDELILAALRHYDGLFRNQFMKAVEASGETPRERLLGIFDVAHEWFSDNRFYGCIFINAVGEYAEPDTPIREVCKGFKQMMRRFISELVVEAGIEEVDAVSAELALLLEGAIVTAQVSGSADAASTARRAAALIIDDALERQVAA